MNITISNKTLVQRGAIVDGNRLCLVTSGLVDPDRPESTNNGNYCSYAEFLVDDSGYYIRDSMSYHGDIEPMPEWENVSEKEWIAALMMAILF